jgi:opacity protein-like surface antigen
MKKTGLILVGTISLFSMMQDASASLSSWWQQKTWHPIVAVGGGSSTSSDIGESKYFPIIDPVTDQFFSYRANNSSQTTGVFNGFLGAEWMIRPQWSVQAGLEYNQVAPFSYKGNLIQGADIESSDAFTYSYGSMTRQLFAEGKLLYNFRQCYHPYVLLGLGAAFNKAYGFSTSVPADLTFTRIYQNNTNTSFSYTAGLGIDADITSHFRVGFGYRFTDLGKVQLGRATIDAIPVSGTLSQSNLYANQAIAQLTFVV